MLTKQKVPLNEIRLDGTQARERIRDDYVETYAQAMKDGARFPDVVLFHDGKRDCFWVGDGHHRVRAKLRNKDKYIDAEVRLGDRWKAFLFNLEANREPRGLPMTIGDRGHSVRLMLKSSSYNFWTDGRIAEAVGCTTHYVAILRRELREAGVKQPTFRIDGNGTVHKHRVGKEPENKRVIGREEGHYEDCPECSGTGKRWVAHKANGHAKNGTH